MLREMNINKRFKVVVRQSTGKVQQVHETQGSRATLEKVAEELTWIINHPGSKGNTLTVSMLDS